MADDMPTMDDVFGKPGSPLHEAWMDYLMAWDPQERFRAHVRLLAMESLTRQLRDPKRFVHICGI